MFPVDELLKSEVAIVTNTASKKRKSPDPLEVTEPQRGEGDPSLENNVY